MYCVAQLRGKKINWFVRTYPQKYSIIFSNYGHCSQYVHLRRLDNTYIETVGNNVCMSFNPCHECTIIPSVGVAMGGADYSWPSMQLRRRPFIFCWSQQYMRLSRVLRPFSATSSLSAPNVVSRVATDCVMASLSLRATIPL